MNPEFVDPVETRVAPCPHHCRTLPTSRMFVIKRGLSAFREENPHDPTFDASQGDGGASLAPIHVDELTCAIRNYLTSTAYGTPEGDPRVRQAILERYYRAGGLAGLTPQNIVTTAGGRDALQKWYQAITLLSRTVGQSVIVGAAPWTSYAQGGYMNGMNMLRAPRQEGAGFKLTPHTIAHSVEFARSHQVPVAGLIITTPDNPSGTVLEQGDIAALIERAVSLGIPHILLDWMYEIVLDKGLRRYDIAALFQALSSQARKRLTVLGGLTKAIGASNVRHAHLLCGDTEFARVITSIASHTVLTPGLSEAVAWEFYQQEHPETHPWARRVIEPTAKSRALFRAWVTEHDQEAIVEQGYYAFLNVERYLNFSIPDADALTTHLTAHHGLAVIPGSVFHQPHWIRFSLANTPEVTAGAIDRLDHALSQLA